MFGHLGHLHFKVYIHLELKLVIIGLPSPHSSAGLGDKVRENVDMECTLEIAEVKKKKKKKKKSQIAKKQFLDLWVADSKVFGT